MFTSLFGWFSQNTVIEGIGNELLLVFSFLGLLLFLILAWMSTSVGWEFLPVRITVVRDSNGETNQTTPQGDVEVEREEILCSDEPAAIDEQDSESASDSDLEQLEEDTQDYGTSESYQVKHIQCCSRVTNLQYVLSISTIQNQV